ncbi:hypothetical protein Tco_0632915 [Tanacetum coccineum]
MRGVSWSHGAEGKDSFVKCDMTRNDNFIGVQVKAPISAMIVRVPEKDRWCGSRGKFVRWKGVRVTKASKCAKMGDRKSVNSEDEITELKDELEIGLIESPNSLKVVLDTSIRGTFASESIKTTAQIAVNQPCTNSCVNFLRLRYNVANDGYVRVYDLASMSCSYVLAPADIVLCLDTYTRSYGRTLIVMGSKDNTVGYYFTGVRLWNAKAEAALELEEVTNEALELMRLADGHLQV